VLNRDLNWILGLDVPYGNSRETTSHIWPTSKIPKAVTSHSTPNPQSRLIEDESKSSPDPSDPTELASVVPGLCTTAITISSEEARGAKAWNHRGKLGGVRVTSLV